MIKRQNNQQGFTLLETLVAITIVTLTIVGPLAMAAQASRLISVAKNQLVATYLAQEAMEVVRYARDTNMILANANTDPDVTIDWLTGETADGGLFVCISDVTEDKCYFDYNTPSFFSCDDPNAHCSENSTANQALLWKHTPADGSVGDGYVLKGSRPVSELTPTTFRRFIQIVPIQINGEVQAAKVIVKVVWVDIYGAKTLYTQENIYKYR